MVHNAQTGAMPPVKVGAFVFKRHTFLFFMLHFIYSFIIYLFITKFVIFYDIVFTQSHHHVAQQRPLANVEHAAFSRHQCSGFSRHRHQTRCPKISREEPKHRDNVYWSHGERSGAAMKK